MENFCRWNRQINSPQRGAALRHADKIICSESCDFAAYSPKCEVHYRTLNNQRNGLSIDISCAQAVFWVGLPAAVRCIFPIKALPSITRAVNLGLVADEAPMSFGNTVQLVY